MMGVLGILIALQTSGLTLSTTADKQAYGIGEPVVITVTLTNTGSSPENVTTLTSCPFTIYVSNDASRVYDFSRHVICAQVVEQLTLQAKQSVARQFEWNQSSDGGHQVNPDAYTVVSTFTGRVTGVYSSLSSSAEIVLTGGIATAQSESTSTTTGQTGQKTSGDSQSLAVGLPFVSEVSIALAAVAASVSLLWAKHRLRASADSWHLR